MEAVVQDGAAMRAEMKSLSMGQIMAEGIYHNLLSCI